MSPFARLSVQALLLLVIPATVLQAQAPDSTASADTAAPVKKKKGLFGKIKDIANDKTVKSVTKAAACAGVVPGASQVVQATGQCTPGMSGMAGVAGAAGVPGAAAAMVGLTGATGAPGAAAAMVEAMSGAAAARGRGTPSGVAEALGGDGRGLLALTRELYRAMGRGVDPEVIARTLSTFHIEQGNLVGMSARDAQKAMAALAALPGDAKRANTAEAKMAAAQAEMMVDDPS